MRGLTAALLVFLVASVEGGQLSVEELLRLRQSAVREYFAFTPRQVTSLEVAEPPVVDGRLDDACWAAATDAMDNSPSWMKKSSARRLST